MTEWRREPTDELGGDRTRAHVELLARADLFSGLDRIALVKLAAYLDSVRFSDGAAACVQGEPGDSLYLISHGTFGVSVTAADGTSTMQVASLSVGACFGEMALLTGESRSATV